MLTDDYNEELEWREEWTPNTPFLSTQAESTPESRTVKMRPVKPLPSKKGLDFPSPRYIHNLVHPEENVESLIFPEDFLNFTPVSFDITLVILLRSPCSLVGSCRDYRNPLRNFPWNVKWNFLVIKDWILFVFTDFLFWVGN